LDLKHTIVHSSLCRLKFAFFHLLWLLGRSRINYVVLKIFFFFSHIIPYIKKATYIKLFQLSMGVKYLCCITKSQCEKFLGVENFIKYGGMYRNKHTNYPTWLIRIKTRNNIWKILLAHITPYSHFTFHKILFATAKLTSPRPDLFFLNIFSLRTDKTGVYIFFWNGVTSRPISHIVHWK
jgi:hypothetical protein